MKWKRSNLRHYSKFEDLTGKRFGKLVVLGECPKSKCGNIVWKCQCDCGTIKNIYGSNLRKGDTISCGCHRKTHNSNYKHGMTDSRLFHIWSTMKRRCYAESSKDYKNYGARGIYICEEWLNKDYGFINFISWALDNGYDDSLSIDRIDVNKNYEPSNCKWSTPKEQANNRRPRKTKEVI